MDEFTALKVCDQATVPPRLTLFDPEAVATRESGKPESRRAKKQKSKAKTEAECPLWLHPSGRWCKKIRGRFHYFGRDKTEALAEWERTKDDLLAGREPRAKTDGEGTTVLLVCNAFTEHKERQRDNGEITPRTYQEYFDTCEMLVKTFGRGRLISDLMPGDFASLREKLAKQFGPVRLGNVIQRIRTTFNFAFEDDLIETPVRYGASFKKPSAKVLRLQRSKKGRLDFTAEQIRDLLAVANPTMAAMILLGICAGLGNNDCGLLKVDHLDLDGGWLTYPRPKTGIMRRAKLWPEVVSALRKVLETRPQPSDVANAKLVFVTVRGASWSKGSPGNDPVGLVFGRLLTECELTRPGLGFYSLRRTFETVASGCLDQVAIDTVMGHVPPANDMAAVYRQVVADARLECVADHVHSWLYPSKPETRHGRKPTKSRKTKPTKGRKPKPR